MRRTFYLWVTVILVLSLLGCSGDDDRSFRVAEIFSDQQADGDIAFDPVLNSFTIENGPPTVFFGIDDLDPNLPEFRAFLDFPLDGSTGEDVVPVGARIRSAAIEVFINEVSFALTVPALIDLVQYPITGLQPQDFSSPPLAFRSLDFFDSDQGNYVAIDVTPLMQEAQRLALTDFQVRFLLDFALTNIGFIGIEDRPAITLTAPLLVVEYE